MSDTETRYIDYLPIDELRPAPRNSKLHDRRNLSQSFARFGYIEPIVIDERTGRMVAGHGRIDELRAARRRNPDHPPKGVKKVDGEWHVPVLRGASFEDDDEAEAYLLASNRIGEGLWDDYVLAEQLATTSASTAFEGTGFDGGDLADLLTKLDPIGNMDEGFDEDDVEPVLSGFTYRIVIKCQGESHQRELLESLLAQGLEATAILS